MALGWLWWRACVSVDAVDAAALCVAGVALGDMDRHFAWQAWHLWHWAGSGGALGSQYRTGVEIDLTVERSGLIRLF